jgi:hypothetical protein
MEGETVVFDLETYGGNGEAAVAVRRIASAEEIAAVPAHLRAPEVLPETAPPILERVIISERVVLVSNTQFALSGGPDEGFLVGSVLSPPHGVNIPLVVKLLGRLGDEDVYVISTGTWEFAGATTDCPPMPEGIFYDGTTRIYRFGDKRVLETNIDDVHHRMKSVQGGTTAKRMVLDTGLKVVRCDYGFVKEKVFVDWRQRDLSALPTPTNGGAHRWLFQARSCRIAPGVAYGVQNA